MVVQRVVLFVPGVVQCVTIQRIAVQHVVTLHCGNAASGLSSHRNSSRGNAERFNSANDTRGHSVMGVLLDNEFTLKIRMLD